LALADDLSKAKLSQEVALSWLAQTKFPARSAGQGAPRAALGSVRARKALQPKFAIAIDGLPADRGERSPVFGQGPALVLPRDGAAPLKEAVEAAARDAKVAIQTVSGADSTLLNGLAGEGTQAVLLALPVKFGQTPAEVVDLKDVQALKAVLLQLLQSGRVK
jgi:putative aminopeptidase FrvX